MATDTTSNNDKQQIVAYSSVKAKIAEMKEINASLVFDYESKKGETEARSHIYTLRQLKTAADTARKNATAEAREFTARVNSEGKAIIDEIESMITVHMEPLEAKAAREQARIDALDAMLRDISGLYNENLTSKQASIALERAKSLFIDESYAERKSVAMTIKLDVIAKLEQLIPLAKQREAEAEEKSRLEAERDKQAFLEQQAQLVAEIEKQANLKAELAAQQERQRLINEQAAKDKADKERAANIEHRRAVNRVVLDALVKTVPLSEDVAKTVIESIIKGYIPNVSITY
jgi:hypothetical protein